MKKRKAVVLSIDAMVGEDLEYLRTENPVFNSVYESGSIVSTTRTVWPSVTYPAHTTMSTGAYPDKHGVVNNSYFCPGFLGPLPWHWFADSIKCPDIFTAAKNAGLTTAGVFWPVTGAHRYIDYNLAEYWPQKPGETYEEAYSRAGTSPEVWKSCVEPYIDGVRIRSHPGTDDFLIKVACAMIRNYRPDLIMIHTGDQDAFRHRYGIFNEWTRRGARDAGRWFLELTDAAREAGVFGDTDFFLTSDHGQLDIVRTVKPNVVFADHGLIETNPDGSLRDWKAYVFSSAQSAQVMLKDPSDCETYCRTYDLLKWMRDEGIYGINEVYTAREAKEKEHLSGDFSFVIESDGYSSFSEDWKRPMINPFDLSDYRFGRATHGYLPDKGPQPFFFGFGPDIRAGVTVDRRPTVDEAPTVARCLGIEMPWADGKAIDEFFI